MSSTQSATRRRSTQRSRRPLPIIGSTGRAISTRWPQLHIDTEHFDASLWRIVRAGDEVVAGAICEADRYGGGWVTVLFTRRPWRGRGLGRALLRDAFQKFRGRGERNVGLGVDAENASAFRLYESAGMRPVMGWVMHEKKLGS